MTSATASFIVFFLLAWTHAVARDAILFARPVAEVDHLASFATKRKVFFTLLGGLSANRTFGL
jgi:hypothetical protein